MSRCIRIGGGFSCLLSLQRYQQLWRCGYETCYNYNVNYGKRGIFTALSELSPLSATLPMRKTHVTKKHVRHPAQDMFDVVADIDSYSDFLPFCVGSHVTKRIDMNRLEAELAIGFHIFTERYSSNVELHRPHTITVLSKQCSMFKHLISSWEFSPVPSLNGDSNDNCCLVNFKIDFEVNSSLHARAVDVFFKEVAMRQIAAFEARCSEITMKRLNQRTTIVQLNDHVTKTILSLTPALSGDSAVFSDAKSLSSVRRCELKSWVDTFRFHASGSRLDISGFARAIRHLRVLWPGNHDLFRVACSTISTATIFSIFACFDGGNDEGKEVDAEWLATQLFFMSGASSHEKLRLTFDMLDRSDNGILKRNDIKAALGRQVEFARLNLTWLINEEIEQLQRQFLLSDECKSAFSDLNVSENAHLHVSEVNDGTQEAMLVQVMEKGAKIANDTLCRAEYAICDAVNIVFQEMGDADDLTFDAYAQAFQRHPDLVTCLEVYVLPSAVLSTAPIGVIKENK